MPRNCSYQEQMGDNKEIGIKEKIVIEIKVEFKFRGLPSHEYARNHCPS